MILFSILCVLSAVPILAYLGGMFLRRRDRRDRTLGLALCLSSLFALFYGGASLLEVEEDRSGSQFITRLLLAGAAVLAWGMSFAYAIRHSGSPVTVKVLTFGLVVLLSIWMTSLDAQFTSGDLPLLVGLAAWLTFESTKPRGRYRSQPPMEDRSLKETKWKKSA